MAKEARYITNEEMFELLFDHAKSRGIISKAWWEDMYLMPSVSAYERGKAAGASEVLSHIEQYIKDHEEDDK